MILRDPVHGLLAFESEEASVVPRLLASREVQRLRRIKQLGVTSLAFPGAEHTRFAHALGTAHVMNRLLARLRDIQETIPFWQRVSSDRAQDALAAALLHDVGHGPLSHLFESVIPSIPYHEEWSLRVLLDPSTEVHRTLAQTDPGRPARVADLIRGRHELPYLARAVSGALDVDRCDYLLRDAHATGVRYGDFDLDWLLRSLRLGLPSDDAPPSLAVDGYKGLVAIEEFLLARFFMFQQVYFHKSTRAAEFMIRTALAMAVQALASGDLLPGVPPALRAAARGEPLSLGDYLELDDPLLWNALHAWENADLPALRDLCRRIRQRYLFKTLELSGEQAEEGPAQEALDVAREIGESRGFPREFIGLDIASDTPLCVDDDPPQVVLSGGRTLPLHEASFLLGRLYGATFSKVRLVFPAELREDIRRAIEPR
ncbi:MAG: HD domain-containing protein [Myxococcales bacterium]|nr:HD domain-containing protein [Polyangiaceae bacterium]MDW8251281.1 HD domain-containing protein [Myxococcales bacterium]